MNYLNSHAPESSVEPMPVTAQPSAQLLAFSELASVLPADASLAMPTLGRSVGRPSNPLHQVKTTVTVHVGAAELTVGELLNAKQQQVIRLDRLVDGPVDILLEGQVIARGILVAVDDCFGVRITELPQPLLP